MTVGVDMPNDITRPEAGRVAPPPQAARLVSAASIRSA